MERKITGRMHGDEFAEFSAILGWKALKDSVDQFGEDNDGFTELVTKLEGKDPDDAFSSIPYVCSISIQTLTNRRKDLICCTRFKQELAALKFLNLSCLRISAISVSNRLPPRNLKTFYILGSQKSMAKV